jgi:hypothetical protein
MVISMPPEKYPKKITRRSKMQMIVKTVMLTSGMMVDLENMK